MVYTILWSVILAIYLFVAIVTMSHEKPSLPMITGFFLGFIGLSQRVLFSLQKSSLKFYFWTLRILHRLKNKRAKWWMCIRYDGNYNRNLIGNFREYLVSTQDKFKIKVRNTTDLGVNFIVNQSLNFYVELHSKHITNLDYDFVSMELSTIEVGFNDADRKLNQEIIPLFEKFESFFKPENRSYDLQVEFEGTNPFLTAFAKHVQPESIEDFHVKLRVKDFTYTSEADSVSIGKEKIYITSQTINGIKELGKHFLLFSPDIHKLQGG